MIDMRKNLFIAMAFAFLSSLVIYVTVGIVEAPDKTNGPEGPTPITNEIDIAFRNQLEESVRTEMGQPIEGYEPAMFMQVFPNLEPVDFDGVDALIGYYEYEDGVLQHEIGDVELIHSAAGAISDVGYKILLQNIEQRLELSTEVDVEAVIQILQNGEVSPAPPVDVIDDLVSCSADAKICPDGTGVGRIGPNCEFAACPGEEVDMAIQCTEEMKSADACIEIYAPVCGLVNVQCITTPCDPIPETFSNGCTACVEGNVISYTEGACEI